MLCCQLYNKSTYSTNYRYIHLTHLSAPTSVNFGNICRLVHPHTPTPTASEYFKRILAIFNFCDFFHPYSFTTLFYLHTLIHRHTRTPVYSRELFRFFPFLWFETLYFLYSAQAIFKLLLAVSPLLWENNKSNGSNSNDKSKNSNSNDDFVDAIGSL